MISLNGIVVGINMERFYEGLLERSCQLKWFGLDFCARILIAYSFIFIGYTLQPIIKKILDVSLKNTRLLIGGVLIVIGVICSTLNQEFVDLHFGFVRNPIITYFTAIILLIAFIMVTSTIHSEKMCWIGENTLMLLGMQIGTKYVSKIIIKILEQININIVIMLGLLGLIIFMGVAIIFTKFLDRYFPWIIKMP